MSDFKRCRRIFFIMIITLFIFNLYALRLAQIQLLQSRPLTALAVGQRTESLILAGSRGDILDRNGMSLTDTFTRSALVALPGILSGREEEVAAEYSWVPGVEQLVRDDKSPRPLVLAENIDSLLLENMPLPGGIIRTEISTRYGPDRLAPHVVGYTDHRDGIKGIERSFNEELSPQRPCSVVAMVDGRRRLIPGLGYRFWTDSRATKPYNVHLTLDRGVQQAVEQIMDRRIARGAVVVMDPWTGDLLAMASLPAFDQIDIGAVYSEAEGDTGLLEASPFMNRAISSYPPGSTFKMVAAAAYLDSGGKAGDFTYYCPGYIEVGDRRIFCANHRAHGHVDLTEAMAQSCNGAFITLGWELGAETLLEYAEALGFGRKAGLPLEFEAQGNLPPEGIDRGILALSSMGQGPVDVTPLQLARAYSAVANGGYLPAPRLVDRISTRGGITIKKYPVHRSARVLEPGALKALNDMLHQVTTSGTGRAAASPLFEAAAKTGTAQTGRVMEDGREKMLYWIAGFAPREAPRYTLVVFIEEAIGNATSAAVFKEITEAIWNLH